MQSFDLYLPTHLVFGRGRIEELPRLVEGRGKRVLITSGGSSAEKSGLLPRVRELLAGYEQYELKGIEPNPRITSVRKGAEICREKSIDFIVAVGGGSVIDATKAIAAGAFYDGDPWDLVKDSSKVGRATPIFSVLTLSATGSEYDSGGVISNLETNEKMAISAPSLFPVASICDPEYTFSVSAYQTAAGAADMISHTFEQYLVKEGNIITDAMCEAMLRTVIKYTPVAIKDPENLQARSELMMASSFGCCGLLAIGRTPSPWPCHGIEHEISAFHDVTHGVGLAIITPHWMKWSLDEETAPRFAQYAERVWGVDASLSDMDKALEGIRKTREFFSSIGIPARLRDIGVDDSHFEEMADHVGRIWWDLKGAIKPVNRDGVLSILRASL